MKERCEIPVMRLLEPANRPFPEPAKCRSWSDDHDAIDS
jgi:hypothetical protein